MGDIASPLRGRASRWQPLWHRYTHTHTHTHTHSHTHTHTYTHTHTHTHTHTQLEYGDWEKVGGGEGGKGEEGEEEEEGKAKRTAIAREALLKFGPMKFTQMSLEHDLRSVTVTLSLFHSHPHITSTHHHPLTPSPVHTITPLTSAASPSVC